jgi:hypothetical protein
MSGSVEASDVAYPCRAQGSDAVHLTAGTVDGKRGQTLCGLAEPLLPTEAVPTCRRCTAAAVASLPPST